jgi:NADH dehydrogenase
MLRAGGDILPAATKVVVVGGGYAGLAAVRGLLGISGARVVLLDPSPGHALMPEMPSALAPDGAVERHVLPFSRLLAGTGVVWRQVRVTSVDGSAKVLVTEDGARESFDWAVVAVGTTTWWPEVPGLRRHAVPFRTAADVFETRRRLLERRRRRVLVGGGGITGVELAGELAAWCRVTLVEAAGRILPGLGPGLARYADRRLRRAGVRVAVGRPIVEVGDGRATLEGGAIAGVDFDVFIWAGGVAPPAVPTLLGVRRDPRGYPVADPWGCVAPGLFVAGDLWIHRHAQGIWPQTAEGAIADGRFVASTIAARVMRGEPGPRFVPSSRGMLVSLDPHKGVGWVVDEGIPVWGRGARLMKDLVFVRYRQAVGQGWGSWGPR